MLFPPMEIAHLFSRVTYKTETSLSLLSRRSQSRALSSSYTQLLVSGQPVLFMLPYSLCVLLLLPRMHGS